MKTLCRAIIKEVLDKKIKDIDSVLKVRGKLCKEYKPRSLPTLIQILSYAKNSELKRLNFIQTKPTRAISGVSVVAIMTKPFRCPHVKSGLGPCIMCPGGIESYFGNVPQSYTGREPATMRGIRNKYDSYLQVMNRLEQYILLGVIPDKIELIIMGGTFPSVNKKYQEEFVKYAFKAMNDFSKLFFKKGEFNFSKFKKFFELPGDVGDKERIKNIHEKLLKIKGKCGLGEEQKKNEKTKIRCVGLTIETRPDYATQKEAEQMLKLGCTRVELGMQSVYGDVLKFMKRGHNTEDTKNAFRTLKNYGFKINVHYMLGFKKPKEELEGLKKLFSDEDYRPDMLKLYPVMVVKGTRLYELWKTKKYKPLTTKEIVNVLSKFKSIIPKYVRVMRVQRDIPGYLAEAGASVNNLRQYIKSEMSKQGLTCQCIRCREIRNETILKPEIKVIEYNASQGKEYFLSFEEKDKIIGFCRLRIFDNKAFVRELHVYSRILEIGTSGKSLQHKGFGKKLIKKAEEICKENKINKLYIISGIGVREYYRKLGYKKEGYYMSKLLKSI